ncbi:GBS Bsp-like repeat-containing protein [Enterococcus cecorum]|nr:GBS Bsp-like repeat-containing protein [Enterococcus cecorum]CAI3386988.1 GBS Bsp-like repeat-containing protein [Enterococcus cecorum]CAI3422112.1 GBS Bsp-like repeat-containing protein [Enterococcus cecorum]CAI3425842.1 GBS Bsp-like repeat-containing protein [Enterococcus cecorum]CAI3446418.1 GBS Bsp-like repeat-containing protein [Enterococcus cecorum]
MIMKKWHVGVAFICTSVLLSFSATTVQADTHLNGKIQNVNQKEGSYEVVIDAAYDNGIAEVYAPTWSDKQQKDIKWYKARKQADGSYVVHMNIANHKYNRGTYTTHVYMYGKDGKQYGTVVGTINLPGIQTKLNAEIKNVNRDKGSYDVVINGQIDSGIKEILVPIWSDKYQKDIKWYKAQKQTDGSYIAHMNIANHKYNRGTYTTHVYMYGNSGKQHGMVVGNTNLPDVHTKLNAEIKNVNRDKGSYDVVINGQIDSGIKEILVPIWSDKYQKDIKWYKAQKQTDGSYIAHMNIANHKYNRGTYTTHVYMYGNSGKQHGMVVGNTNLPDVHTKLNAEIKNVNRDKGSYDVVINGQIDSGIKEILVPTWSDKYQKDIKWYKAQKQTDGSYVVHMNIANHKYNRGTYTTHVYMYGNNGRQHGMVVGNTNLPGIQTKLNAEIKNVNRDKGSYDVVINGQIDSGIKGILVPIWSDKYQKDIKWYKAQKQTDGSYVVHMNIANHKYNRGTYTTHVYMYGNNGKQHGMVVGNTVLPTLPDTLKAQIKNVNKEAGSYDVVIQAASQQGIARVEVPTWSTANQSDLVWYKAAKQSDGSYIVHMNIANHKYNRGNYTSHVYLWHPNGSNTAINIGQTDLTKPSQEQPKPTEQPGKSDNNQQGNTNTGNTTEPTKPTEQPGKSEEPQVRELDIEKIKSEVFRLTNLERTKRGLKAISYDRELEKIMPERAQELLVSYSHKRPNGKDFSTLIREKLPNYYQEYQSSYEILAGTGEEGYKTESMIAQDLVNNWMNSSAHKSIILNNDIIVGAVGISSKENKYEVGKTFYGVQIFSIKKEQATNDSEYNGYNVDEDGTVVIPMN